MHKNAYSKTLQAYRRLRKSYIQERMHADMWPKSLITVTKCL